METREFFYTEAGAPNGKRYVVKSHGWLKSDAAPAASTSSTVSATPGTAGGIGG